MEIEIKQRKFEVVEVLTKVNIPEKQVYYWHNGIRRAYSVKPMWTTWNTEKGIPEEIYSLEIIMVDPSDKIIKKSSLQVSRLFEILMDGKNEFNRLIDNVLNDPNDETRNREEFMADLKSVLNAINESA